MKMIMRILLTWALALALVLAIIDAVKSFAAGRLEMTSIGTLWQGVHVESFESAYVWLDGQLANFGISGIAQQFFDLPAWSVFLALGLFLTIFARRPRGTVFIQTH